MAAKDLLNTGVLYTDRRNFYVSPQVTKELWKNVTPFLSMLSSKPRKPTPDPDFKMFEHESGWIEQYVLINKGSPGAWSNPGAGVGAPGATIASLTLDTPVGLDASIGSWLVDMEVEIWDTTDTTYKGVAVVSALSGSDATLQAHGNPESATNLMGALADNDKLYIIGSAFGTLSNAPDAYSDDLSVVYNSSQIHRTAVEISGTLAEAALRGYSSELARLRMERQKDHQIQAERFLLLGVRAGGTGMGQGTESHSTVLNDAASNPRRTTMGIRSILKRYGATSGDNQNVFSEPMAAMDWDRWVDISKVMFRNIPSTGRKQMFCGGEVLSFFSKQSGPDGFLATGGDAYRLGKLETGSFGYNVQSLVTPHGVLDLVNAPLLRGRYDKTAIIVDPDHCEIRQYRPSRYNTNIKTDDGYDGVKDEWFSDFGLGVTMQKAHAIIEFT